MRPLEQLIQWEDAGAGWRVAALGPRAAVVELLTCTGEPADVLRSGDPELLAYLAGRRSSEDPPVAAR